LCLVKCGGIGDALAALLRRKGIDEEVRRAHQTFVYSGGSLNGYQLIHEGLVDTAAKLR